MSEQREAYIIDAIDMLGKGYENNLPPADIFGKMSGYTPTPDILCKKYGFVTALVWGRMWRYCQGYDRVCRAKLETIAESLGMSERTIIRHIEILVQGGYFIDKTPELKNRPHIYADTGKLRLAFSTEVIDSGVTESQRTMTESQRQGDRESHEDTIKETIKESASAVFSFYQNNFELLTQYNSSKLGDMIDDYSAEWVLDALKVCVDNGKKSISYAAGILKRWKREGRRDNCEKTEPQAPQDNPPEIDESLFVPNPYAGRRR